MLDHVCHPETGELEAGGFLYKASLSYIVRPCLKHSEANQPISAAEETGDLRSPLPHCQRGNSPGPTHGSLTHAKRNFLAHGILEKVGLGICPFWYKREALLT